MRVEVAVLSGSYSCHSWLPRKTPKCWLLLWTGTWRRRKLFNRPVIRNSACASSRYRACILSGMFQQGRIHCLESRRILNGLNKLPHSCGQTVPEKTLRPFFSISKYLQPDSGYLHTLLYPLPQSMFSWNRLEDSPHGPSRKASPGLTICPST